MTTATTEKDAASLALERASDAARLTEADALAIWEGADIHQLGAMAAGRRARLLPDPVVTYMVDRNVNYTNVCITDCQFCAFYRPPGHRESYTLSFDEIGAKIEELVAVGGTRVLLQGGHNPGLRLTWYLDLMRFLRSSWPGLGIDAFSPSEIDHLASLEGATIEAILAALVEAGMTGLPGGGAEILDDEIRSKVAPKKQKTGGWLGTMRIAQRLGLATSATIVIGFGESMEHRLRHLSRLRSLHEESLAAHGNGFTSFIAWTAQLKHNSLGRSSRVLDMGATAFEYLRFLALARLYLDNFVHVATSWPTLGDKIAELSLRMGADDFGSTMLEENVVSASGTSRTCMSEADIHRYIRNAGFRPAKRDTRYQILQRFE